MRALTNQSGAYFGLLGAGEATATATACRRLAGCCVGGHQDLTTGGHEEGTAGHRRV